MDDETYLYNSIQEVNNSEETEIVETVSSDNLSEDLQESIEDGEPESSKENEYASLDNEESPFVSFYQEEVSKNNKIDKRGLFITIALILCFIASVCNLIYFGMNISKGNNGSTVINKAPTVIVNELKDPSGYMTASEIYDSYSSSVVAIQTEITTTNIFGMAVQGAASGSGFFISDEGYILTNYHVIENANAVKVTTKDQQDYEAKIVGYEKENDVAILKVDNVEGITPVVIGDSDAMSPGEDVVMIGNPLGSLTWSISKGIISALNREMTTDLYTNLNMFQVDSPVNQGNSGGPLFNMRGEVLGIVSAKYASTTIEGLGFCIPINDAIDIATELIENGKVTNKAAIGVMLADVSQDMISTYGMVEGAYITEVNAGSAAEKAGIKKGDIAVKLDDKDITSASSFRAAIRSHKAGETSVVKVYRSGEYLELTVTYDASAETSEETSAQNNVNPNAQTIDPNNIWQYFFNQF